jgi:hypothetical protein
MARTCLGESARTPTRPAAGTVLLLLAVRRAHPGRPVPGMDRIGLACAMCSGPRTKPVSATVHPLLSRHPRSSGGIALLRARGVEPTTTPSRTSSGLVICCQPLTPSYGKLRSWGCYSLSYLIVELHQRHFDMIASCHCSSTFRWGFRGVNGGRGWSASAADGTFAA